MFKMVISRTQFYRDHLERLIVVQGIFLDAGTKEFSEKYLTELLTGTC